MTSKDFIQKQNEIYADFKKVQDELVDIGLEPRLPKDTNLSGYLVILRHSKRVLKEASNFSHMISKITDSLVYEPNHIHTTITDYLISESTEFDPFLLKDLNQMVKNLKSSFNPFSIRYFDWLINRDSIIAAGNPDHEFFKIADTIVKTGQDAGIQFRYPYMSHITVSRFFEETKDFKKINNLLNFVRNTEPLGESKIKSLEVGFVKHYDGNIEFVSGDPILF